jgi:hypothetical protein
MKRPLSLVTLLAFAALGALAQDGPLSMEAQQAWQRTKNNVLGAAAKMPEDKYGYKPAPESQSFRDLVAHTADSAMGACSGYSGERKTAGAASMNTKAELAGALEAAMAECDKAYGSLTDAKATEMIAGRGGQRSRLGSLYGNTIHIEHEYAQMAVHLRANGVVPPSSEGRMGGGGGKKKQQ